MPAKDPEKKVEVVTEPVAEVPKDVAKVEAPLSRDALAAKLELLSEQAKEAGLSPLRMLGEIQVRRGLRVLDAFLGVLEDEKPPEKKT